MFPAFIPAMLLSAADVAEPRPVCAVSRATVFYDKFADLPNEIQSDILKLGAIAEAGQPYNETDGIIDASLPMRRFNMAGRTNGDWFIWLTHGGLVRHEHVRGYQPLYAGNKPPTLHLVADFTGEPCVAINAFVSGVRSNLHEQSER